MLTRNVVPVLLALSLGCWGEPAEDRTAVRGSDRAGIDRPSLAIDEPRVDRTGTPSTPELPTAMDQPETESDREVTRRIREAIVGDEAVSVMGANVMIVTRGDHVTLRGDVDTSTERDTIASHAVAIAGATNVDNRIVVTN